MINTNKKILYSLLAAFVLFSASCSKSFLDEESSTSLPASSAIRSVTDLTSAVNGVYMQLLGDPDQSFRFYYGGDFALYADIKGPDMYSPDANLNQLSPVGRYVHEPLSNFSSGYYKTMYVALARVNDILTKSSVLNVSDDKKAAFDDAIGQLYALRGLIHFDLARLYAKLPTVATDLNDANSGIVLADRPIDASVKASRSTLKETYDLIVSDFTKSLPLLSKTKTIGKINYWAAEALRARVFLYLNDNSKALADAADVIAHSSYSLYRIDNYTTVWDKEGTDESLFEVLATEKYNAQRNSIGYYTSPSGYPEVAATANFVSFLEADPNDIRSKMIGEQSDNGEFKAYYPLKYPGRSGSIYVNNAKVIRLSEVYLIAAEAALKGGAALGAESAVNYINRLRANRISGYNPVASITLDDLLNERRKELFAEGHIAWDYWRNGKSFTKPEVKGVIAGSIPTAIVAIPFREIQITGSKLVQNPGY